MRNITIGQYYPADSILHKLDPRVKFLGTLVVRHDAEGNEGHHFYSDYHSLF